METFYFHGVLRAGDVGHYLYYRRAGGPIQFAAHDEHYEALPWRRHDLDAGLTWNAGRWVDEGPAKRWREHATAPSVQGDAALTHKDGWTALSWHDYTGDSRGGSNSTFIAPGTLTHAEMWELFERHFPNQHVRQPGPLVLLKPAPS